MAPPAPLFEFTFHRDVASLEAPLGLPATSLEELALTCDDGSGYVERSVLVRGRIRDVCRSKSST